MEKITTDTKHTNGFALASGRAATAGDPGAQQHGEDWRYAAMEAALHCRSQDGTPQHVLLAALQAHLPQFTARVFWEDRNTTLEALRRFLPDLAPIMTPALRGETDDENRGTSPVLGWWRGHAPEGEAAGEAFEVILAPDFYGNGDWVVAGRSETGVNALVETVIEEANRHRCRCRRFGGGWHDDPKMETEVGKVCWDDIILAPETLSDIRRTIDQFFAQKETFAKLRFPWRRGVLLVGPPGTGKTMVCKAAAASYPDLPFLYVGDIGRHGNASEIEQVFAHARKSAPCILAFEDMDGLVDRSNRTIFLNELDGFRDNEGLLIIASSNHPERIDEALLKRPSRFDRVYHIGLPELVERREFCRRLLARTPSLSPALDTEALSERVAEATGGFTPAFLKEAFLSAMLQMAHEGLDDLDEAFGAAVLEQVDLLRKYLKKARNPEALADLIGTTSASDGIGFRSR